MRFTSALALIGLTALVAASPVPGSAPDVVIPIDAPTFVTYRPKETVSNEYPAPPATDYNEDPAPTDLPVHTQLAERQSPWPIGTYVKRGEFFNEDGLRGLSQPLYGGGCWTIWVPHVRSYNQQGVDCRFYSDGNCQTLNLLMTGTLHMNYIGGRARDMWRSYSCDIMPGAASSDVDEEAHVEKRDVKDHIVLITANEEGTGVMNVTVPLIEAQEYSVKNPVQLPENAAVEARGIYPGGTLYNEVDFKGKQQLIFAPGCKSTTVDHVRSIKLGNISCFFYADEGCTTVPISASWMAQEIRSLSGNHDSWKAYACTDRPA